MNMTGIIYVGVGILVCVFGFIVVYIADESLTRMFKMIKFEYYIVTPISIILWVYECLKSGKWSLLTANQSNILIWLLLFILAPIWASWMFYERNFLDKKYPHYIKDKSYLSFENAFFRLLLLSFIVIIAVTIIITLSVFEIL